jgi:YgiT-type zinc finger domain-containing protein
VREGTATVTLTRDSLTLVVKDVPALVCDNCGEEYVDAGVAKGLEQIADEAQRAGVQVDVRQYQAV